MAVKVAINGKKPWTLMVMVCRPYASFVEHKIFTNNWKLPSQTISIQQMTILIALLNLSKAYNNLIAMKMVECYIKDILLKGIME